MENDPNSETERGNHLAIHQECLYQFRESAEFVAFPDWDDFLIPLQHTSLLEAFRASAALFPLIASFYVQRRNTKFLGLFHMR